MGILANLAKFDAVKASFPGTGDGRALWRQVFGDSATDKERERPTGQPKPINGGSWGRSATASGSAATARLVQALRSMAPGGWTDDRWEQSKHLVGAIYVAVTRKGTLLQQSEFQLWKKDRNHPDGKRPVTEDDPPEGDRLVRPYDLVKLLERPNPQDSFGKWIHRCHQQLELTGTALTWMLPNKLGTPMELFCIPTALAIPQPVINVDYPHGFYRIQPLYPYGPFSSYPTPTTSVGAPIPAEWMLRFQYPHPLLRYEGYSPLTALRLEIDQLQELNRSRWYSMKRSFKPSAVMNFKDLAEKMAGQGLPEEEIERIHAEWENEFQGTDNVGKLIVGTPGATIDPWGTNPVDMDYPNGFEQLVSFVLGGGFGITKPAAGMIEDASYSNLFATLKQLNWLTLQPELDDMASTVTHNLGNFFGDDLIVEFRCKRLDDHEVVEAAINTAIQAKAIKKNEVRERLDILDLEPVTDEWGEEIAGTDSKEDQKFAMEQQQKMAGPKPGEPGQPGQTKPAEGERPEPPEVSESRPTPGKLSEGALGPRKGLEHRIKALAARPKKKSVYELAMDAFASNGNGKY